MTPTETDKRKAAALIFTAAAEGKLIQNLCFKEHWFDFDPFQYPQSVIDFPHQWRVKPQPVVRPWKTTKDFPKVGTLWLRGKGDYREHLVIALANDCAFITASAGCQPILYSSHCQDWNMEQHEWSEDRQNWKPCTVEEAA